MNAELIERLAEAAHTVWLDGKYRDGWSYAPETDKPNKKHASMVPYGMLIESDKQNNRDLVVGIPAILEAAGLKIEAEVPKRLEFLSPEFHAGLNYTVRKGTKWQGLLPGTKLTLAKTAGADIVSAEVLKVYTMHYRDLPKEVFELEHSSSCRNLDGMTIAMEAAYGSITNGDVVVVIGFEPEL